MVLLRVFAFSVFTIVSSVSVYGQPSPLLCIVDSVDTSCQDQFGADPGDTFCSGNVCAWDSSINRFSCSIFDPSEESRSLPAWNTKWKKSAVVEEGEGHWGRLGIVQCVATRTCKCQWDEATDDMLCLVTGSETQKAVKFFFYQTYITTDPCWIVN